MRVKPLLKSFSKFVLLPLLIIYIGLRAWVEMSFSPEAAPGHIHSVDGFNVHLVCKGQGSPVVLFETGFGSDSHEVWEDISQSLSSKYKTCYYDRLGTGWSESIDPSFGTEDKAKLLSSLVTHVGDGEPVVLVAKSYGGILSRKAIGEFGAPVEKLVWVDSAHENQHARLKPHLNPIPQKAYYGVLADALFGYTKIKMLFSGKDATRLSHYYSSLDYARVLKSYIDEKGFFTPLETLNYDLADMPVLLLEHDPKAYPDVERWNKANEIWMELQRELAQLSNNSRLVLVEGASHNISGDKPEVLIEHIIDFIE